MERRAASHTEEEELNQRRRLLNQARKGDLKAINRLFELYQVRVYSGDNLKKVGQRPFAPPKLPTAKGTLGNSKGARKAETARRRAAARKSGRKVALRKTGLKKAAKRRTKPAAHR